MEFAQADRCYIYKIDPERQMFCMRHEWAGPAIKPMLHSHPEFPTKDYPWWMDQLSNGDVISLANLDEIPAEAVSERAIMEMQSVHSLLAVPILSTDNLYGFIGFTAEEKERSWSRDLAVLMAAVSGVIAHLFQRQEIEQELRLQRDFAIQIMNTMGQGLVVSDEADQFEYINPAFADMLGYSQHELIGKTPQYLINPADIPTIEEAHFNRKHGKSDIYEVRLQRKDNSELFALINAVPLMRNGSPQGSIAVVTDLTERKQAEYDLRRNESAIRNLYGIASDQLLSHSGRVQALLLMGCQLFRMENAALVRKQNDQHWIVEIQSRGTELYKGMPLEQEQVQQLGLSIDRAHACESGGLVASCYLSSPVIVSKANYGFLTFFDPQEPNPVHRSNDYEFLRLMAQWLGSEIERANQLIQLQDNTEEIKSKNEALALANDQALQAVRLKADFLATMSHEIRTPLNAVIGMSELMLTTHLDERQSEYASIVRDSSQALLSLINDILDFSKIEAGRLTLEKVDFQISTILEGTADLLAARATQKRLALMTFVDPSIPPMVRGDSSRLRQILLNLLSNAVKFTDEGEVVANVVLEKRESHNVLIRFMIRDTGIGISNEVIETLFQPFTQADSSMARKYGGTGLGLSISARLVEMMGGEIGVDSQEGYGTTFWFTVPFERSAATVPIVNRARKAQLDELRLLVIDSNTTELDILHRYLDAWGIHNEKAADSTQALQTLEESAKAGHPFDIAIMDQRIFDTDSLSLAQIIFSRPLLAGVRLIQLISFDDIDQRDQALHAGFSACLNKPVKQSSLLDALMDLVNPSQVISESDQSLSSKQTDKLKRQSQNSNQLILIVEDNPANQKMVLYQLEKLGYFGQAVANGLEAIRALATIPINSKGYDLVLMDCQMPEMDGFETTQRIRMNEAGNGGHIPIVAMTANAMQGDRETCLKAGMDDYVAKPVTLNSLQQVLERYLNNHPTPKAIGAQNDNVVADQPAEDYSDVLDQNALFNIRELQTEIESNLLNELIDLFTSEGPKLLETIDRALQTKDAKSIQFAAHRLKGSSAYLGVKRVCSLCSQIEEQSRDNLLDDLDTAVPLLNAEYRRAVFALNLEKQLIQP